MGHCIVSLTRPLQRVIWWWRDCVWCSVAAWESGHVNKINKEHIHGYWW